MKRRNRRKQTPKIYHLTMSFMCLLVAMLVYLINDKTQMISLATIKQMQFGDVVNLLTWNNVFDEKEEVISAGVNYQLLKDDFYSNGSNEVYNIFDGVVQQVEADSIVLLCDNGLHIRYSNLTNVHVKKDERILQNSLIGSMDSSVQIEIMNKNEEKLTVLDALSNYED